MNELKKQLALCIRARYPILYLVTWEEDRAEELLAEIGVATKKKVITWSLSTGFDPKQDGLKKDAQVQDVLKYIEDSNEKAIFVLKDIHPLLENELIVRRLRDLARNLKKSYKTVVLVSPVLKIPPELEKDLTVYDLPLPDAGELTAVLNNLVAPYRESKKVEIDLGPELLEKVVQATLGLTKNEAENVYAKALITERKFGWDDLPAIISEKK